MLFMRFLMFIQENDLYSFGLVEIIEQILISRKILGKNLGQSAFKR